jgi:hypothetical protein
MKNAILVVLGFLLFPLVSDMSEITRHFFKTEMSMFLFVPSYGVATTVTGGCTKDVSKNGHGWTFVRREYNTCNTVQIFVSDLIYGEYSREN